MASHEQPMVIIGFTDELSPLEPAWPSTHRALLPIAGKALIVYLLESLVEMGCRHVRIGGSIQQFAVEKRLGSGEEWGLTIRYSDLHGPDLLTQTIAEQGRCLYFNGDQLHQMDLSDCNFDQEGVETDPSKRIQTSGYWTMNEGGISKCGIDQVSGGEYIFESLTTAHDYQRVNLKAAAGGYPCLQIPGQTIKEGVSLDWDTTFAKGNRLGEQITIGKHCHIGRRVFLESHCVIGNGSVLCSDTHLRNVSVLPNCFVGKGTKLQDAIVSPMGVFDLEGKFYPIEDGSIIGRTRDNEEEKTGIPTHILSSVERRIRKGKDDERFSRSHRLEGNINSNAGTVGMAAQNSNQDQRNEVNK